MAETAYTDSDVGKYVMTADGDRVGTVTAVRHGTPRVDPDPDMFDRIKRRWAGKTSTTTPIRFRTAK
ncbi:PRC-barrel domain containing protein [Halorubrum saccharovorum]|uniref:PRC-barrel domain containing protein n=1 Tax=Halorubrum saccharovorum TaxID=2248 RepID=UPI001F1D8D9B|nr:PRC-barrel domain containing protein [Halorubrum saccharovorum]